jgi:hypothetical protein
MINIPVAGASLPCPSGAADTDWAANLVALLQALGATVSKGPAVQRLSVNVTPAGTGADTSEDNLMTYPLAAGLLGVNGQGVRITAWGDGVNTANATTVRCYFGGTLCGTLVLQPSQSNTWRAVFEVFRTGATAQVATSQFSNGGTVVGASQNNATPAETLSGAVTAKFTGQRATSSVSNSIRQLGMAVEFIP